MSLPRPAATVILFRDDGALLLMQRSLKSSFFPGAYVFPGGVVEQSDAGETLPSAVDVWAGHAHAPVSIGGAEGKALYSAYARAAAREVAEEVGLALDPNALQPWARWITPEVESKRFDTLFFTAPLPAGEIALGAAEAEQHVLLTPQEALARFERGQLMLPPPTYVTVAELAASAPPHHRRAIPEIMPVFASLDGARALLLPGDPLHPAAAMTWPPSVTPRILLSGGTRPFQFVVA